MNTAQRVFESLLWASRLVIVLPVILSTLAAIGVVLVASVDALGVLGNVLTFVSPATTDEMRSTLRLELIADLVGVMDSYLIAAVLLIFAFGLYELFVGKLELVQSSPVASRLLLIQSLDDLKDRLAKVILVVLVVKFFQLALAGKYNTPLELMELAIGVFLIALSLYVTSGKNGDKGDKKSSA